MPEPHTDWFEEVLRARRDLAIDFEDRSGMARSVAVARFSSSPDRPLTVDEIVLLTALASARTLPRALSQQIRDCNQLLGCLVLDGLLEVKRDGGFCSGVSALGTDTGSTGVQGEHDISDLALRYAIAVKHLETAQLSGRLYAFNSLPRKRKHRRDSAKAFAEQTGIDATDPSLRIGGREWDVRPGPGWLYFRRGASTENRFKLYFCPHPRDMARAIPGFAATLGRARSSVFKIAFPAESCVRADKIVAYFSNFGALQQCVANLMANGSLDATAQAVPFSASIPGTSLLSWGVDPPNLAVQASGSWRSWLTRQVAECVRSIPASQTPREGLVHLKTALRLRDIDPVRWLPLQQLLSCKWSIEL